MMASVILILLSLIIYANVKSINIRQVILCIVSTFIYWQFVGFFCLLLPFVAVATWCACLWISRQIPHIAITVTSYIALLAICFLIFKVNVVPIYLPIGFSILCFSGISLVIDIRNKHFQTSLLGIYTYLSFFPKILAGPIERYKDFMSQLPASVSLNQIYRGFKIVILCLFTKYIIVEYANTVLSAELYGANKMVDIFIYAAQFYLDFWAYSFLAIGIALLYGINLSVNFFKPYRSKSFHDFWHRWNITLSAWLRDYLYIPLGGNRKGFLRYAINVVIVFIVSAFWHDIALTFLLWGVIHSALLIIERKLGIGTKQNIAYTALVAIVCGSLWQLFRYTSLHEICDLCRDIFTHQEFQIYPLITLVICVAYILLIESDFISRTIFHENSSKGTIVAEVLLVSLLGIITLLGMNIESSSPFFYLAY